MCFRLFYTWYLQLFNPKLKFANECQMNNIFLNWTERKIGIADTLLLKWVFGLVCFILPFSYISWETSVFAAKWPFLTRPSDFDRMNCLQLSSVAGRDCSKLQLWRREKRLDVNVLKLLLLSKIAYLDVWEKFSIPVLFQCYEGSSFLLFHPI